MSNTRLEDVEAKITLTVHRKRYPERSIAGITRTIRGYFSMSELMRWMKQTCHSSFSEFETAMQFALDEAKAKDEMPKDEVLEEKEKKEVLNALLGD